MDLWIVRRPFKSNGTFYDVGTLITNPENIKLFKTKCNERKILTIEGDGAQVIQYFSDKFGMDVQKTIQQKLNPVVEDEPAAKVAPAAAKPVASATKPKPAQTVKPAVRAK